MADYRIPVHIYVRPSGRTRVEYITAEHATPEHYAAWQKLDEAGFSIGMEDLGPMHAIYFADKDTGYDAIVLITENAKDGIPLILKTLLTFDVVAKRAYVNKLIAELDAVEDKNDEQGAAPF